MADSAPPPFGSRPGLPAAVPLIRRLPAERATRWLGRGWQLFMAAPAIWVGMSVLLLVLTGICSAVPVFGHLALTFFMPVAFAGLMFGCRALDQGMALRFEHLLAGFQCNTASLVTIGALSLVGHLLIGAFIMMLTGGAAFSGVFGALLVGGDPAALLATLLATLGGMLLAMLLGVLLLIPLAMALSFAPALAIFDSMDAVSAVTTSFRGSWKNQWPFLVLGLLSLMLLMLVPLTFGLALLVVIPVLIGALYTAYVDIFSWIESAPPVVSPPTTSIPSL